MKENGEVLNNQKFLRNVAKQIFSSLKTSSFASCLEIINFNV